MIRGPQISSNSLGVPDDAVAFENVLLSQVLLPPRASIDSYSQNVQTSSSSQGLLQMMIDDLPSMEIYTAYAYQDEEYFDNIKGLLSTVALQGWKIYCTQSEVVRSGEWKDRGYLTTAHLILLLISRDFLRSPFCYCSDMESAVAKHGNGVFIIPINVRSAALQLKGTSFGHLDALPIDGIPIANASDKDLVYDEIFAKIVEKLNDLKHYVGRR